MDASSGDRWDTYALEHPNGTFFHRAGWKRVIEGSFGHTTHFLYAERNGSLCGILPLAHYKSRLFGNALISNACCMGGGPIADDPDSYDALDAHALALMRDVGADYLEYRSPHVRHPDWDSREDLYSTFSRPIAEDDQKALLDIPRKQRAVVRKALSSGLSDAINDDIGDFYDLYALTVRNLGTPVFSKSYFRNLKLEFGKDCDILTVYHSGKPISSVLSFYFRDRVMPYYTGARTSARALGAADFMYWRLMRRGVANGYSIFDFGRSKVGTGPYDFKKNWGFAPIRVVHEFKTAMGGPAPEVNPRNPKYRLLIQAWKRLPVAVANVIGPRIVRNIG